MRAHVAFAVLLTLQLAGAGTAAAQTAPAGACVLPTGAWCIPPQSVAPGDACVCLTSVGWRYGTQR